MYFLCAFGFVSRLFAFDAELEMAYRDQFTCEFGYTLIGAKPASIDECDNAYLSWHSCVVEKFAQSLRDTFARSENFIFKTFDKKNTNRTFELINIAAVKKLVAETKEVRDFIRQKYTNESQFYDALRNPKVKLFDVLKNDPYIIGLVLGYGRTNAAYFCQRSFVGRHLDKRYLDCALSFSCDDTCGRPGILAAKIEIPYAKKKSLPDPGFASFGEEWAWVCSVWWNLHGNEEAKPPFFVRLPFYICRHGGDSEAIREKYEQAAQHLADLFYEKSFHQAVMEVVQKERKCP